MINTIYSYRLIFSILFILAFVRPQSFGKPIFSKEINCINPSWSFDTSRIFTVESLNHGEHKLMIGRALADTVLMIKAKKTHNTQRGKKIKKIWETNVGWIREVDAGFPSLIMVTGDKKSKREKFQQVFFTDNNDQITIDGIVDVLGHTKKKIKSEYLRSPSRCFTSINNEDLFFMNLSKHDLILRTLLTDKEIIPVKGFASEKDVTISSISSSSDGSKLLVVCNNENVSEIYTLDIDLEKNKVISKIKIDNPDEELFVAGIRHPDKSIDKYILIGTSENLLKQFLCRIFIMEDNKILSILDGGYFQHEDFSHQKRPVGQWDRKRDRFYFLKKADTGGGELYYLDGHTDKNAGLGLKNISDFEFSLDSEYLLVITKSPSNMLIYRTK